MMRVRLTFRFEPSDPRHGVTPENVQFMDPRPYECPFCHVGICKVPVPGAIVKISKAPVRLAPHVYQDHPELKKVELWQVGVPFVCNNPECKLKDADDPTRNADQIYPLGVAEDVKEVLS